MVRDKLDWNKEIFSSTTRLEDVLPDYIEFAVYSKYLASDLLERLDGCAEEADGMINACTSKAVANGEVPIVIRHVVEFMIGRQKLKSFYAKVISKAEDVLNTYGVDYFIEPHPTSPGEIIMRTNVTAGGFKVPLQSVPVRSACLPVASSLPDEAAAKILGTVVKGWQQLEAIVQYASLRPNIN